MSPVMYMEGIGSCQKIESARVKHTSQSDMPSSTTGSAVDVSILEL